MSQIELVIDADNKPDNLLDPKAIVQQCRDANSNSNKLRGVPLVNKSHGAPYAWVKYGWYTTMGEALTQDFVGKAINGNPNAAVRVPRVYLAFRSGDYGYIVMEYIDGSTCDNSDAKLVAAAVQSLIAIRGPTAEPGPVGRGPIRHRFFVEWKSSMTYHSVQELEQHINGILAYTGWDDVDRVNFGPEVEEHGLRLCPCDMKRTNFMRDSWGRIVALDFGDSCFLPVSFFAFALREGDDFTQRIARWFKLTESTQLDSILTASYALVPYGTNKIGIPRSLRHRAK